MPETDRFRAALRARLAVLAGGAGKRAVAPAATGFDPVRPGLAPARLHEVMPAAHQDTPAAMGFLCAALIQTLAECAGMVLWAGSRAQDFGAPYPAGLYAFGLDPNRVLCIAGARDAETLLALEEGLRCSALAAVAGALGHGLSLTASRRLQLAAERSGVPALLLLPPDAPGATAAATRWRIAAHPSDSPGNLIGPPRWSARLARIKGAAAPEQTFVMEWDRAAYRLRVVAGLGDGAAQPGARRAAG